jgi:hypothetical protein
MDLQVTVLAAARRDLDPAEQGARRVECRMGREM